MKKQIIYLLAILYLHLTEAQFINNGSQITIDGISVRVDANFLNIGNIKNDGNLIIDRHWMNVGVYTSEEGLLIFNGEDQQIMNNGQTIRNLELRNGVKTVVDDLVLEGSLNFTEPSILTVTEEARLTLGQSVLVAGTGSQSYIDGTVHRSGTGDLFFPLGLDGNYLPVTLVDVVGSDPSISLSVSNQTIRQELGGDLESTESDHLWEMQVDESYGGGYITLPYQTDSTNLVIGQATSANGKLNSIGSRYKDGERQNGLLTSKANAVGPYFTIARAPESKPLPPLKVINALTPVQDGKHDYLRIENIEMYPDNLVEIFDRQGNKVFSIQNYDNRDRVFRGTPNVGLYSELPDGNYFYTIKTGPLKVTSGFLFLKR